MNILFRKCFLTRLVCFLLAVTMLAIWFTGCNRKRPPENSIVKDDFSLESLVDEEVFSFEEMNISTQIEEVNKSLKVMRESNDYIMASEYVRSAVALGTIKNLALEGYIEESSILYNEENAVITYMLKSGILSCELLRDTTEDLSGFFSTPEPNDINIPDYSPTQSPPRAIILFAANENPSSLNSYISLQKEWISRGVNTELVTAVTLDKLTELRQKELICLHAHGLHLSFRIKSDTSPTKFAIKVDSWIQLEQTIENDIDQKYQEDLLNHRIGIVNGRYMVAPGFFSSHYGKRDLLGSIFYISTSYVYGIYIYDYSDWADALLNIGVVSAISYSNSVSYRYSENILSELSKSLFNGIPLNTALAHATDKYGADDKSYQIERRNHYAVPKIKGNPSAKLKGYFRIESLNESDDTE